MFLGMLLRVSLAYTKTMDWREFDASVGIHLGKTGFETVCSGVLLTPQVVLTAGHCLIDLRRADVVVGEKMGPGSPRYPVERWMLHPGYKGNVPGASTDLGLMFLREPLTGTFPFSPFGTFKPGLPFERIGYGLRDGRNRRTHVNSSLNMPLAKHYVLLDDAFGFPGDSGGPVYQRDEGNKLCLVGVHTGRKMDKGEVLDHSFVQLLYAAEIAWIKKEAGLP